jgi:hypothetical protein
MSGWVSRSAFAIVIPSSSPDGGIRMSVRTTSGVSDAIAARSDSPLSHVATRSKPGSLSRTCETASRTR